MVGLHVAVDIDYHLQSAKRTFFANKSIFLSRNVSIRNKLKFYDAIVTPIACLGARPRCIRAADMDKFDIHFRCMIRCVVGAPDGICWHDPWHVILNVWNQLLLCARPNQSETVRLRSHSDMGRMKR